MGWQCSRCGEWTESYGGCPTCTVMDNSERTARAMEQLVNRQSQQSQPSYYDSSVQYSSEPFGPGLKLVGVAAIAFAGYAIFGTDVNLMFKLMSAMFGVIGLAFLFG